MKAAIHKGRNYMENLEIYKNTNFEEQSEFVRHHPEIGNIQAAGESESEND